MLIDPKLLIQLHTIVELGSFVAAAERLGLTQPGLSRNMRALEARVGVRLLVRGKHGALPTDEGKALAAYGRTLRELMDQAAKMSAGMQRGDVGEVRLGASFSIANGLIAQPVAKFLESRPHVRLRVIPGPTPRLLEELEAGQLDLVVGGTQLVREQHGVKFEPIIENELLVVGRAGHPLARAERVKVEQLQEARWVACLQDDPLRRDVEAVMAKLYLAEDAVALETGSMSLVVDVLQNTDFLAIVPSGFAGSFISRGLLARIGLEPRFTLRPIGLAYRVNDRVPPAVLSFIKVLRVWARDVDFTDDIPGQ